MTPSAYFPAVRSHFPPFCRFLLTRLQQDFRYLVLEALDNLKEDMLQHFESCHQFIDEGRQAGGVLIHCQAGISRSATVVTASHLTPSLPGPKI